MVGLFMCLLGWGCMCVYWGGVVCVFIGVGLFDLLREETHWAASLSPRDDREDTSQ